MPVKQNDSWLRQTFALLGRNIEKRLGVAKIPCGLISAAIVDMYLMISLCTGQFDGFNH
jgi:hypothetical protein